MREVADKISSLVNSVEHRMASLERTLARLSDEEAIELLARMDNLISIHEGLVSDVSEILNRQPEPSKNSMLDFNFADLRDYVHSVYLPPDVMEQLLGK